MANDPVTEALLEQNKLVRGRLILHSEKAVKELTEAVGEEKAKELITSWSVVPENDDFFGVFLQFAEAWAVIGELTMNYPDPSTSDVSQYMKEVVSWAKSQKEEDDDEL